LKGSIYKENVGQKKVKGKKGNKNIPGKLFRIEPEHRP
jgi:hypothetical protein